MTRIQGLETGYAVQCHCPDASANCLIALSCGWEISGTACLLEDEMFQDDAEYMQPVPLKNT